VRLRGDDGETTAATSSSMPSLKLTKRLQRAPLVPGWGVRRAARHSPRMMDRCVRSRSRKRGMVAARLRSSGSAV
jgi:hypothetical protein